MSLEYDYLRADLLQPLPEDRLLSSSYAHLEVICLEPGIADFLARVEVQYAVNNTHPKPLLHILQGPLHETFNLNAPLSFAGLGLPILASVPTVLRFEPPPFLATVALRTLTNSIAGHLPADSPKALSTERSLFQAGCRFWLSSCVTRVQHFSGQSARGKARPNPHEEFWTVMSGVPCMTTPKDKCRLAFGHQYKFSESRLVGRALTLPEAQRAAVLAAQARRGGVALPTGYSFSGGALLVPTGQEKAADAWMAELLSRPLTQGTLPTYRRCMDRFPKEPPPWQPFQSRCGMIESRSETSQRLHRQLTIVLRLRAPVEQPKSALPARSAQHPVVLASRRAARTPQGAPGTNVKSPSQTDPISEEPRDPAPPAPLPTGPVRPLSRFPPTRPRPPLGKRLLLHIQKRPERLMQNIRGSYHLVRFPARGSSVVIKNRPQRLVSRPSRQVYRVTK